MIKVKIKAFKTGYYHEIVGKPIQAPTAESKERSRLIIRGGPMIPIIQDNDRIAPTPLLEEPDAHGQAALLLAESMLHMLVETGVLNNRSAITVVEAAAEVKVEVATVTGESHGRMQESLDLLSRIQASFETDRISA